LTLLLTHTHWDHIQGFPFFRPIYRPQNRLRILGYEGARNGLANALSAQMESPYFPVALGELPGNIEIEELRDLDFKVGGIKVQAFFANHPGICVGYRIFTREGSIAFFPDNELHYRHERTPREKVRNLSADSEFIQYQDKKITDFVRDADVLIMDAQFDAEEYKHHVGWGHGCMDDVVALALRAGVKQLFLFHHDPDHDDDKIAQMVERARELVTMQNGKLRVDAAREGLQVKLAAAR
ncbi:MAG TPA: MBL fold metallo-hydrolase, partial [Verrucomicrobiae bacterium]|nr:MBL fold metallo-hydrolase [Verrucomicrobiae bacterium]